MAKPTKDQERVKKEMRRAKKQAKAARKQARMEALATSFADSLSADRTATSSSTVSPFNERLATFNYFPPSCPVRKELLAAAGFVYQGPDEDWQQKDRVICLGCKLSLHDWKAEDMPLLAHVLGQNGDCPLLHDLLGDYQRRMRSQQWLSAAQSKRPIASYIDRLATFSGVLIHPPFSKQSLAAAGFVSFARESYKDDAVTCNGCGLTILQLQEDGDAPLQQHGLRAHSPCPILKEVLEDIHRTMEEELNKSPYVACASWNMWLGTGKSFDEEEVKTQEQELGHDEDQEMQAEEPERQEDERNRAVNEPENGPLLEGPMGLIPHAQLIDIQRAYADLKAMEQALSGDPPREVSRSELHSVVYRIMESLDGIQYLD